MKDLFIIHGWAYSVEPWVETLNELTEYGINPIILKVPGLTDPSPKVFTIEDYVAWADESIPKSAIALGHSNGGRILMNLAVTNPDKLSGLILLNSAGIYEKNHFRDTLRIISKVFRPLRRIKFLRKLFHRLVGANDYGKAPANMRKTLSNILASDKNLDPSKVTIPTQIIWGGDDQTTPLRQAKQLHQQIRGSKLHVYDGWGHAPYIQHPEELAKAIAEAYDDLTQSRRQNPIDQSRTLAKAHDDLTQSHRVSQTSTKSGKSPKITIKRSRDTQK